MGLTVKNKTTFEMSEDLTNFFSLPLEKANNNDYEVLKRNIYNLDIDNEEKAYIINKINLLSTNILNRDKNNIEKEIDEFKRKYNL